MKKEYERFLFTITNREVYMAKIALTMEDGTKVESNEFQMPSPPIGVSINSTSGTLTEDQRRILSNPNNYIIYLSTRKFYRVSSISGILKYACIPYTVDNSDVGVITISDVDNSYTVTVIENNCYEHKTRITYYTPTISPKTIEFKWYSNYYDEYTKNQFLMSGVIIPIATVGSLFFASSLVANNGTLIAQGCEFEFPTLGFHPKYELATITAFTDTVGL